VVYNNLKLLPGGSRAELAVMLAGAAAAGVFAVEVSTIAIATLDARRPNGAAAVERTPLVVQG
jgi:hypothetical protein